jgi:hypothetical protein
MNFMDEQQQRRVNEAGKQFADAVRASFQAVSERGASAQELQRLAVMLRRPSSMAHGDVCYKTSGGR